MDQNLLTMFSSRISVIEGHNKDNRTDDLYKPLRDTFLLDTTAKKSFLDDISRFSHISHSAKAHTFNQNHRLGQQTLIFEDAQLKPTHDLSLLPAHRQYCVINAQQKKYNPISHEELEKRLKAGQKQEVIVYTYGKEEKIKAPVVIEPEPKPPAVKERRKSVGLKVTQPKYNLFSVIDEAFNTKSCTCPANELIASRRSEANWEDIKKMQDEGILL